MDPLPTHVSAEALAVTVNFDAAAGHRLSVSINGEDRLGNVDMPSIGAVIPFPTFSILFSLEPGLNTIRIAAYDDSTSSSLLDETFEVVYNVPATSANVWEGQSSETDRNLSGVHFVNETTGWAVGWSGTILNTTDGGITWNSQESGTFSNLFGLHFVDANTGWAVGWSGTILNTTDGGITWNSQESGTTTRLYDVYFVDSSTGWAVGNSGTIRHTADGGATWTGQSSPINDELGSISFVDSSTGWAVAGSSILKTSDGSTWSLQTSRDTFLYGIHFVNATTGWAVGQSNTILKTTNGGDDWSLQESGAPVQLYDVYFVDSSTGWAVGQSGTILKTTDGGDNWNLQDVGSLQTFGRVYFVNATTGWAVGTSGTILRASVDTSPPEALSAVYRLGTGTLEVGFSEAVDYDEASADKFHIRESGQSSGGVTLSDVEHTTASDGDTLSFALSDASRTALFAMSSPQLDTDALAVRDLRGNLAPASAGTGIDMPVIIAAPASNNEVRTASALKYALLETAVSGAVTFTRTGGAPDGALLYTYVMRPADLAEGDRSVTVGSMGLSLAHDAVYTMAVSVTAPGGNTYSEERTGIRYNSLPPQVTSVTISSNGPDSTRAGVGDTITVTAKVSGTVRSTDISTGKIAGRGAIWDVSGDIITMYSTIRAGLEDHDREGPVKFSFLLSDDFGNTGIVNTTTDGSSVKISFRPSYQPPPPPAHPEPPPPSYQPEPPAPPPTQPEPPVHSPPHVVSVTISSDNIYPELADVGDTITVRATLSGPVSASDVSSCMIAMADATCTVSGSTITMYRTLDGHEYEDTAMFSFILFEGTDYQVTVDDTTDGSSVGIHFFESHCRPWSSLPWC